MIIIIVFDKFIAPEGSIIGFIATAYNSTCIKLEWKSPAIPNGVIGYKIYQWEGLYPEQVGNSSIRYQVINIVHRGQIIQYSPCELRENQMYFYQIIPYNIKYYLDGPGSEIVNATTKEDRKANLVTSCIEKVIYIKSKKYTIWKLYYI